MSERPIPRDPHPDQNPDTDDLVPEEIQEPDDKEQAPDPEEIDDPVPEPPA